MKRRKEKKFYNYECSLTGQNYRLTEKANEPENLVSVQAYYELNADKDDRPDAIKAQLGVLKSEESKTESTNTEE